MLVARAQFLGQPAVHQIRHPVHESRVLVRFQRQTLLANYHFDGLFLRHIQLNLARIVLACQFLFPANDWKPPHPSHLIALDIRPLKQPK